MYTCRKRSAHSDVVVISDLAKFSFTSHIFIIHSQHVFQCGEHFCTTGTSIFPLEFLVKQLACNRQTRHKTTISSKFIVLVTMLDQKVCFQAVQSWWRWVTLTKQLHSRCLLSDARSLYLRTAALDNAWLCEPRNTTTVGQSLLQRSATLLLVFRTSL